jgi:hypothetical protein
VELPHTPADEVPSGEALRALRATLPLLLKEFGFDGSRDLLSDLVLERKDIANSAVVSFGPYSAAGLSLSELG